MSSLIIAVDLAKNVFELALSSQSGKISERKRFSRSQFERFWSLQLPCRVVMEACATSHYWGRYLRQRGFEVILIPPHYVRPYVRRNKTDRSDCEALLEAFRCAGIHPVAVKGEDQQAITALHRLRSQWLATRTQRINAVRALLAEFGISRPAGAQRLLGELPRLLDEKKDVLPPLLYRSILATLQEIHDLQDRIRTVERDLELALRENATLQALQQVPGVGVLTATALYAAVGNIHQFPSGRHLASWLGLTPRESSSGNTRRLGKISKQGDVYLRMLLVHGARSCLLHAQRRRTAGLPLSRLQQWVLQRADHAHSNQAVVALANKMARTLWAVWFHERTFDDNYLAKAA